MTISTIDVSEFCDTNVLVYMHDGRDPTKQQSAAALIRRLWVNDIGVVSIQVLQEFYYTVTRRIAEPLPAAEARRIVEELTRWRVFAPAPADVLAAIDASVEWQVSFWDAMLLVAANRVGASVLWSEDLSDGQTYGAVTVRNPFR